MTNLLFREYFRSSYVKTQELPRDQFLTITYNSQKKKKQTESENGKLMRLGKRKRKQKKEAPKITNSSFPNTEKSGDKVG